MSPHRHWEGRSKRCGRWRPCSTIGYRCAKQLVTRMQKRLLVPQQKLIAASVAVISLPSLNHLMKTPAVVLCWEGELEREVEWVQCSEYVKILHSMHAKPFYEIGHFFRGQISLAATKMAPSKKMAGYHVYACYKWWTFQSIAMQPQLEFLTFDVEIWDWTEHWSQRSTNLKFLNLLMLVTRQRNVSLLFFCCKGTFGLTKLPFFRPHSAGGWALQLYMIIFI